MLTCAVGSEVANQEAYSLPSDFLKMQAVFLKQTTGSQAKWPLYPISVMDRDPLEQTGDPDRFYIWGVNVSGANQYIIGLNPIPKDSNASSLHIYYRQQPLTMVASGQAPEIPVPWQDSLVDGALWQIYQRWGEDPKFLSMHDRAFARWQARKQGAKAYISPITLNLPRIRDTAGYLSEYA